MIQRKATESDIPDIIQLLKISLGDSLIPKSQELWTWKHLQNPFGKSPVILAEESGQIIGIRAFLKWQYQLGDQTLSAYRAVDTATHPEHQGKGIFKKLSLSLIEEIKNEGVDLIFNTPNSKSTPGYLKMGWEKWGRLPLKLNFHLASSKNNNTTEKTNWDAIKGLVDLIEAEPQQGIKVKTKLVSGYLNWRYRDNPLFKYQYISDGRHYLLIYRIKEGTMGREFRICDFFSTSILSDAMEKELNQTLNQRIKQSGARFSSFSGLAYPDQKSIQLGLIPIFKIGPLVTLRKVNENPDPVNLDWGWSLGDLEVF